MEKVKKNTLFNARYIATLGVLLALVIVLQAFGGSFTIGPVSLNFSLIPVALGALVLGPVAGAILGFGNGIVVLVQVIQGLSPFYVLIWSESPVITTLICLFKVTVAGFVSGLAFRLISRKNVYVATFVAAALIPIINTALFVLGCLCMYDTIYMMYDASSMNIFVFICITLVTFNFFIELAINLIVAPALNAVYNVVSKQHFVSKNKKKCVNREDCK